MDRPGLGLMPSENSGEGNFLFLIPLKVYGTVFQPSMMSACPLPILPIPVRIPEREDFFQWPDFGVSWLKAYFEDQRSFWSFWYHLSFFILIQWYIEIYYHDFVANFDAICYCHSGFGNPRAMENPFLLSFGVLWFRWHNYLAEEYIKMKNIQESDLEKYDEQIFNYARKWVVASHQVCTFNEVPVFLLCIKLIP